MLENIIGQDHIVEKLLKALENKKIAHAYLFEGAEGIGKKKIANFLARALVCQDEANLSCGKCDGCTKARNQIHPDIKIIEDGNIKIEELRDLLRDIQLKPYEGNNKVYIIHDADKMSIPVQNVLLKTLEEPPLYTTIILLTSKGSALIPTIISRCQVIKLYPVNLEIIKNYLIQNENIDEEKAHMLAAFSNGIIGQAVKLLKDPDFYYIREEVIKICSKLLTSSLFDILEEITFFEEKKLYIDDIFNIMISWYRDILVYRQTKDIELITNIDKKEEVDFQGNRIDLAQIKDIIFIIEDAKNNLESNVQFHLNIEVMLLNIQEVLIR